jgi:hemerythrin
VPGALVIDDSAVQVREVAALLSQAGYAPVHTAVDWVECRSLLAQDAPALVVIDVHMAGMISGDVMAMQLRINPQCREAKFVLYSGLGYAELQSLASRCGADAFMRKGDGAALVARCLELVPVATEPMPVATTIQVEELFALALDPDALPQVEVGFMHRDHLEEARLLNEVVDGLERLRAGTEKREKVVSTWRALASFTRDHFAREERAMAQSGFPPLEAHRSEHQLLLAAMDSEVRTFEQGGDLERLTRYVAVALPAWFLEHIEKMDQVTSRFLSERVVQAR